jgi:Agrin NtA domain
MVAAARCRHSLLIVFAGMAAIQLSVALKHNSIPGYYKLADRTQRKCIDVPLTTRVRQAAIVFTGTVRQMSSSSTASVDGLEARTTTAAVVEVKRVMKGQELLLPHEKSSRHHRGPYESEQRRLIVVVGGLGVAGSTTVCHGDAKINDTWIFLTSVVRLGADYTRSPDDVTLGVTAQLRLNSSLVRLSLNNILQVEAALTGIYRLLISDDFRSLSSVTLSRGSAYFNCVFTSSHRSDAGPVEGSYTGHLKAQRCWLCQSGSCELNLPPNFTFSKIGLLQFDKSVVDRTEVTDFSWK